MGRFRTPAMGKIFPLLLALAFLSCQRQPAGPRAIRIELKEYSFTPAAISLPAGQAVQIELMNKGQIKHEFMIGRGGVHEEEGKPHGYIEDFFEHGKVPVEVSGERYEMGSPEEIEEEGWHVEIEPGGRAVLRFTVPEGKVGDWEMGCFVEGHYEAGMRGKVAVVKP